MTAEEFAAMERRARMFEAANEKMLADNKRLRDENARLIRENKVAFEAVGGVVKANDKLKEENARLREALKAFVPETQWIDPAIPDTRPIDVMVRAGELRAARAAILRKVKDEAACPAPDEAP